MPQPQTLSYKVSDGLFLVRRGTKTAAPAKPAAPPPTNHIAVFDVSGSMWGEIDKVREDIKKKLPKMIGEKDTFTAIWFSGRGQYGVLLEAEPVATLADLTEVNRALDRWLRPQGATGFKEPIEEVAKVIERISKKRPGTQFSLFFMSDGCDNCWSRPDILKAVEKAAGGLSAATFVEYGYYADRPLLTAMAEKAGGTLIFSEKFDRYSPIFEAAMQKKSVGGKKIEVDLSADAVAGFAFAMDDGDLTTFGVEGGKVTVPENLSEVWFLSPAAVGLHEADIINLSKDASNNAGNKMHQGGIVSAAYAALSLYATRMKPEVVFPLLKALGDVQYIEQFSACFGKQKYSEFQDATKTAAFKADGRFAKGWDPNKVPRDDAFTVLDVLRTLSADDDNRVLLDSEKFVYNRIGRASVDASDILDEEESEEIKTLSDQLKAEKNAKKIAELSAKIAEIVAKKQPPLKFVADKTDGKGYPISSLTYNEDRPNVSILVRKEGTIDLTSRLPEEFKGDRLGKIPPTFRTNIFRNFTIIKDGLVNVEILPVRVNKATFDVLAKELPPTALASVTTTSDGAYEALINLRELPVINRKMVKASSAKVLFEKVYAVTQARAAQKVYNAYKKDRFPGKKADTFAALYGDEGAKWLVEQGITEGGFSPKTRQAEATDFYLSKELHVSLKGLSSLPSLKDVKERIAKKKLTASAALMVPTVEEVESFLASDIYMKSKNQDALFETWLDGKATDATKQVRELLFEIAQIKSAVIIGQVWFTEFASLDENTMEITVGGEKIGCTVEMKEKEVKI